MVSGIMIYPRVCILHYTHTYPLLVDLTIIIWSLNKRKFSVNVISSYQVAAFKDEECCCIDQNFDGRSLQPETNQFQNFSDV